MTPDEVAAKEHELDERAKDLDAREATLTQQLATTNAAGASLAPGVTSPDLPNPIPATTITTTTTTTPPNPATYAPYIKTHVPITLGLTDGNYTSWRELFLIVLGHYGLTAHVLSDATPSNTNPNSDWGLDDYTVLSWIYGSISADLLGIIMCPGSTARLIWDAIENLFRDNKMHRALHLEADFHNTPQGDLSISDCCAKLKALADSLGDAPFPSFLQTRSTLILEETQKKLDSRNAAGTTLWASGNSVLPNFGGPRPPPPPPSSPGGTPLGGTSHGGAGRGTDQLSASFGYYRGGRGRGRGGRGRSQDSPWQFNPWTGALTRSNLQHQQPAPWQPAPWSPRPWNVMAPGVLGPRPSFSSPQAYAAYGQPSTSYGPQPPPPPPNYNQQALDPALVNALNNMQLFGSDWYMDSGASSHMASDSGFSHWDRDSSMQ
ncbi:hypothetical protein ACQ4PT_032842 [Festuca glaucescens]